MEKIKERRFHSEERLRTVQELKEQNQTLHVVLNETLAISPFFRLLGPLSSLLFSSLATFVLRRCVATSMYLCVYLLPCLLRP